MSLRTLLGRTLPLVAMLLCTGANAQLFRTYLSVNGADTNPCTVQLPCRLLPAALNAVASGGEVWMLDSANYNTGTVTIGKSVTILAVPGAVGSLVTLNGDAVAISAAALIVSLRNLKIGPIPGNMGGSGVVMTGASRLSIDHCLIEGVAGNGVTVLGLGTTLTMTETIVRNVAGWAVSALDGAVAGVSRSQLLSNGDGVQALTRFVMGDTAASVSDSVISGTGVGIGVQSMTQTSGANAHVDVTRTTIELTGIALDNEGALTGPSFMSISGNMVTHNNVPWNIAGVAVISSLGNNHIIYNNAAPAGALSGFAAQ